MITRVGWAIFAFAIAGLISTSNAHGVACPEQTEFAAPPNSISAQGSTGLQAVITMQSPTWQTGCSPNNPFAGGTTNLYLAPAPTWVEIGWSVEANVGWRTFTEWGVNGTTLAYRSGSGSWATFSAGGGLACYVNADAAWHFRVNAANNYTAATTGTVC
jgi:hypothetical protein